MSPRRPAAPVVLRIVSDPAYLCVVRAAAERYCLLVGFDAESAHAVSLALDEALANVINHGYGGQAGQPIHVELQMDAGPGAEQAEPSRPRADNGQGERLCIRVRDFGRQVPADQIAPRPLEQIRPGGLGVHIIRTVMDSVRYRRRGLAGMELCMTKRRPRE